MSAFPRFGLSISLSDIFLMHFKKGGSMRLLNWSSFQITSAYAVTSVLTQPREKSWDCFPMSDM